MSETIIGDVTFGQIIAWVILGVLIGSLVGRMVRNRKRGYGMVGNLLVGLIGAVIGGILFELLDITWGSDVALTLNDFIAAFAGAFIFVGILALINRRG